MSKEGLIMPRKSKQGKNSEIAQCLEKLDEIPNAGTIKKAAELHRQLSYMSVEDLFEPCTI